MSGIGQPDRDTLSALVDDELDLSTRLALEARVAGDDALRASVAQWRALRTSIRDHADYHAAPDGLRHRLTAAGGRPSVAVAGPGGWRRWFAWRPLATGFATACVLLVVTSLVPFPSGWVAGPADDRLSDEIVASHIRSTVGQRLVDVASSDRHTVKPWLSSRLDFSPPVADAPVPGAVFLGGRLDYVDHRPVAALVYRKRQHVIDVYVWPDSHPGRAVRSTAERGYNVLHWARGGMRYWVISDLNREELSDFAQALDRVAPTP